MSINSKSALHDSLFHLRTPLAGIQGVARLVDQTEILGLSFSLEARQWLEKWLPKVDIWLTEAIELTEFLGQNHTEDQDWKGLFQRLLTALYGVEVAAKDAHNIPLAETDEPGDLTRIMVQRIDYVYDHYKYMQELWPTLV